MPKPSSRVQALLQRAVMLIGGAIGAGVVAIAFLSSLQTSLAMGW